MPQEEACYCVGKFREDAEDPKHKGWFVGQFMDKKPRRTDLLEVKFWRFDKDGGKKESETKTSCTVECTFILSGRVKAKLNRGEIELSAGQYVVISPGTPNAIPTKVLEDVEGLTIKAPSLPRTKHLLVGEKGPCSDFMVQLCREKADEPPSDTNCSSR